MERRTGNRVISLETVKHRTMRPRISVVDWQKKPQKHGYGTEMILLKVESRVKRLPAIQKVVHSVT